MSDPLARQLAARHIGSALASRVEELVAAAPNGAARRLPASALRHRWNALFLVAPLLVFLGVSFVVPIGWLLLRAVDNRAVAAVLPQTTAVLSHWRGDRLPIEGAEAALAGDLRQTKPEQIAELGRRLNYVETGFRTLLAKTARAAREPDAASDGRWLAEVDSRWTELRTWQVLKSASPPFTDYYLLNAVDLRKAADGGIYYNGQDALYLEVIGRTLGISLAVTVLCLLLGYPLAYLLASTDDRSGRWLMMLVLLPFWTSLLVRTTAWLVLLQSGGVVNSLLAYVGAIAKPLELIHNRLGVLVAMTHILLPFVVLPLHAVMKGIPGSYLRAAASLGAPPWRAFIRVYLPLTFPGVGAGCLLVFILALGYYITPALVGGPRDQMLSYFIAYFVNQSTNWGMAGALSVVLLAIVTALYALLAIAFGKKGVRP